MSDLPPADAARPRQKEEDGEGAMSETIYLDPGSIHSEMSRRYPAIKSGVVWINKTTEPHWATMLNTTGCVKGPADIVWSERWFEGYHGFTIEMLRLQNVSNDYWKHPYGTDHE